MQEYDYSSRKESQYDENITDSSNSMNLETIKTQENSEIKNFLTSLNNSK
jgi:hypothetical protein